MIRMQKNGQRNMLNEVQEVYIDERQKYRCKIGCFFFKIEKWKKKIKKFKN